MHEVADALEAAGEIPLLHIADVTGTAVRTAGITRAGLPGTRFTREEGFHAARLARLGIEVLTPPADARAAADAALARGTNRPGSPSRGSAGPTGSGSPAESSRRLVVFRPRRSSSE